MDTTKIIKGVVNSGRYTVTAPIVKENYGIYLQIEGVELPETYQVDFSNDEHHGASVTMIGNADGVLIPRQFIDTGKDVFAFLYWVGEDYGKTVYKFRIPNKLRPDRTSEEPTPEEQSVIDQAISALNEAVAQTAQDVIDADASAQSASADADRAEEARTDAQNYATQAEQARDDAQTYANNASASATASANSASASAQIKSDVEDLVEDAQGYAQASAQSATASANSATQAQGYAQSASASAQSASGYASNAQTSAQTASNKASEASQSASQASGYAQTAETAKTDAQTAKTQAETARDNAVTAKTAAETAQGKAEDAQAAAESVAESIPSDYSQLSEDVSDLKEDLNKVICPNLIGNEANKNYPVFIPAGSKVTISTSDGSIFPTDNALQIQLNDANGTQTDYFGLKTGTPSRTVTVNASRGDVYYLSWNETPHVPIMVNIGSVALPYVEYFTSANYEIPELRSDIDYIKPAVRRNMVNDDWAIGTIYNGNYISNTKRIADKTYIPVTKGTIITSEVLSYDVIFYDENKTFINETGWTSPNVVTTIETVTAFVRITGRANDSYVFTEDDLETYRSTFGVISNLPTLITRIVSDATKYDFNSKNIIGLDSSTYYPVEIKQGTTITMSTADGEALGQSGLNLQIYDNDRNYIDQWNFTTSSTSRTITIPYDTYYLKWNKDPVKAVQVEVGSAKTEYTPYALNITNTEVIKGALNSNDYLLPTAVIEQSFNSAFHTGATDFATKCTQFSSLMYGDTLADVTAPKDCESFLFFTDPHLLMWSGWEQECYEFIAQIQKYYNSTPTTFCLCGGDWLGNDDLPSTACYKMGYIDGFMHSMFDNVYMLVGNHDTNYQGKLTSESARFTTRLSNQSIIDLWYREQKRAYFSFSGANTKFYAFDTGVESQALTTFDNYGWEQVAWFANALLTDDSEHMAITAHILYYNYDASDLSQGIQPLMDYVLKIAQAYNNRTSITVNGTTYDYSSRTGKVEFCIGGHTHADATGTLYGIPFILTLNVRNNVSLGASFDLIFVDYDSSKIELVRVGAGEDRTVSLT